MPSHVAALEVSLLQLHQHQQHLLQRLYQPALKTLLLHHQRLQELGGNQTSHLKLSLLTVWKVAWHDDEKLFQLLTECPQKSKLSCW